MVDNLTIVLDAHVPEIATFARETFLYRGLRFVPTFSRELDGVKQFDAYINNLLVRIKPYKNEYLIQNSLHKYYHGSNSGDYTLSQVEETLEQLSEILGERVREGRIRKLEAGLNITLDDADAPCLSLERLRSNTFQPMQQRGKVYGAKCYFSQYAVKGYNKTKEVKLHNKTTLNNNVFRWEVSYTHMASLHNLKVPVPVEKAGDLVNLEKVQYLFNDVLTKYRDTQKRVVPSVAGLELPTLTALARMQDPTIREAVKAGNRHTYLNDRRKYLRLMEAAAGTTDKVYEQLQQKAALLLNS